MSIAPDPLPQDVLDELSRGNAINAIKVLRQSSGVIWWVAAALVIAAGAYQFLRSHA